MQADDKAVSKLSSKEDDASLLVEIPEDPRLTKQKKMSHLIKRPPINIEFKDIVFSVRDGGGPLDCFRGAIH